jgi:bis(5'-nucleosyl)-tetraphosphatase (symmetrical)
MSIYLVGDIQGCFSELIALLKQVSFDSKVDQLYVAGDLVARGPDSLATLRFIKSLNGSAKVVLGNHDLHLLAVYAGIKKVKKQDQLDVLLDADDVDDLMDWLGQQPLLQKIGNDDAYMSHAGISPQWTLAEAIEQATFAQKRLSSSDRNIWLSAMYGEKPNNWKHAKSEIEKFRYTINAFTRMRYCYKNKNLEFESKSAPGTIQNNPQSNITLLPWYELSSTINVTPWVFGHWAALMGECSHKNIYPLDTGCVWGNHLTLLCWHDKKIFTEPAHKVLGK